MNGICIVSPAIEILRAEAIDVRGPLPADTMFHQAARDTYDGLYTCNSWTMTMLRTGGLPVPTAGVLFVGQVMDAVRAISARQASTRHG